MGGRVNWHEEDALLVIDGATDEMLTKLAFLVEGYAKVNARVDTGFMRNAIYTIPARGRPVNTGDPSGTYESTVTGETVERKRSDEVPDLPPRHAGVHSAAEYSLYREMEDKFLYKALTKVKGDTPGVIRGIERTL